MRLIQKKLAATAIAGALVFSPTVAAASTFAAPAPTQPQNAWVTLSQMTPAGATALASTGAVAAAPDAATMAAAAVAAQPVEDTGTNPFPLPVVIVLLGVLGMAVYIALIEKHDHGHITIPTPPVSPS
jgi:hypothetical protein